MKFTVLAALLGMTQSVKIKEEMQGGNQMADQMKTLCSEVEGIQVLPKPQSLLEIYDSRSLPVKELKNASIFEPPEDKSDKGDKSDSDDKKDSGDNIEDSYKEHYGKSKAEIDAENKNIVETQKKCLDFVKKNQDHPKVCNWCRKSYRRPKTIWQWNSEDEVWYKYYDGGWHYWGPSKEGFTSGGWKWYGGYWHNDGYAYKYVNGYWYRFQDYKWVKYSKEVPVNPSPPRGKKICRPYYKMMKQGFPMSLASSNVPRCKVGNSVYMWTDDKACKFLGGVKAYQQRAVCKSGENHKWKRVVKCVTGNQLLSKGGLDYRSGKLRKNLYKFQQCKMYRQKGKPAVYLYLYGKCHWIPNMRTYNNMFKRGAKIQSLSYQQMRSCRRGKQIKNGAYLVKAQGGSYFLKNWKMMQAEDQKVFDQCQFDVKKLKNMDDKTFAKQLMGDIISS